MRSHNGSQIIEQAAFTQKKEFFKSGITRAYSFRRRQLIQLKETIKSMEQEILQALNADLHKPEFEAYVSEAGLLYEEINFTLRRF